MSKIRTYLASILALLLVVSTTGITLNKHYCMGRLAEVSFFEKAENCAEKMGLDKGTPCPMDCCHDTEQHFEVDDFQMVEFNFDHDQSNFFWLSADHQLFIEVAGNIPTLKKLRFYQYSPPLIPKNLTLLHESFLI